MILNQSPNFPNIYISNDGGLLVYSENSISNTFDFSRAFEPDNTNLFILVFYQNKTVNITERIVTELSGKLDDLSLVFWVDDLEDTNYGSAGVSFRQNKLIDFSFTIGMNKSLLLVDGSLARETKITFDAERSALEIVAGSNHIVVSDLAAMENKFKSCFIPLTHDQVFSQPHNKSYTRGAVCFDFSLEIDQHEELEYENSSLNFQPQTALVESRNNKKTLHKYAYLDDRSLSDGTHYKMSVYPVDNFENTMPSEFSSYLLMKCDTGTRSNFLDETGIQLEMQEPHELMSRLTFTNAKKQKKRRDYFFSPIDGEQMKLSTERGKQMLLGNSGTERVERCTLVFKDYSKVLFDAGSTNLGQEHEGSLTSVAVIGERVKHYLDSEHAPYFKNGSTQEESSEIKGKVESPYMAIQVGKLGPKSTEDRGHIFPLIPTLSFRGKKKLDGIENLLVKKRLDVSEFGADQEGVVDNEVITPQGFTKVDDRLDFIKKDHSESLEESVKARFTINNIDMDFGISVSREDVFFVTTPKLLKSADNFVSNFDIFFDIQGFKVDLILSAIKDEELVDDNRIIIFKYSRHTVDELLNDSSKWSNYGNFGATNASIDFDKIQSVVHKEFSKFDKKYSEPETQDDYRYIQEEIRRNRGWNGVLILNIPITDGSSLPPEFDGLASSQHLQKSNHGDDDGKLKLETPLRFEYVAIPVNKTYVQNGKVEIESTAFYGVIDYDTIGTSDEKGLDFDKVNTFFRRSGDSSYRFSLSKLLIRFENSEIRNFISYAFVKVPGLFEDSVTFEGVKLSNASNLFNDQNELIKNLIRLDGSIQKDTFGRNVFKFNVASKIEVEFAKNDIIDSIILTKAGFSYIDSNPVKYRFELDADVNFTKKVGDFSDLLHFESLSFKNIGLKFDKNDRLPSIDFDVKNLQIFPTINFGGKGLLGSFPIKFNRFQVFQIDGTGLLDYDFLSVYSKALHGTSLWSMVFDFDMGTLGDLAALKMLKGELLIGWTKDGGFEIGFKLNGPSKKGVNVEFGPFQLTVEDFSLCTFDTGNGTSYLMRLINARMRIFNTVLPPKDAFDFNGIIYAKPNEKLAWFIAATKAGTINAPDSLVLGVGQRVGPKVDENDTKVDHLIAKALDVFDKNLDPCRTGNPVNEFYQPERNWFLGSNDFIPSSWRSIFDMKFVFNDPDLYGVHLNLKEIIEFDILYKKLSDKLGVYSLEFELPPNLRNIEAGGMAWTLPNLGIDVYTNGDFKLDIGYPRRSGDWSRSCLIQLRPFVGWGGFYVTRLRTASLSLFGPYQNEVKDCTILQTGLAFRIGLGAYVDKGMFYAGASISVYGILEGAFAFEPNQGTLDQFLPDHFALRGRVGAIAEIVGYVNFSITKVSVHVILRVEFGLSLFVIDGDLKKIPMHIEGEVRVRIRFTIRCFKIFRKRICIRITLSYRTKVRFNYTLGKGGNKLLGFTETSAFTINRAEPVRLDIKNIPIVYIPAITTANENQDGTNESYLVHQFAINFFACSYNETKGSIEYAANNVMKDRIITPIFNAVFEHALGGTENKVMNYQHLRAYFLEGPNAENVPFKINYRPVLVSGYSDDFDELLLTDGQLYNFDENESAAFKALLDANACQDEDDNEKCPFRPIPIPVSRHLGVRRKDKPFISADDRFALRWEGMLDLEGGNEKEFAYHAEYSESDLSTLDKQFDKYFTQALDRDNKNNSFVETMYDLNEDLIISEYFKFIGLVTLETYMEHLIEQGISGDIEDPEIDLNKLLGVDGDWELSSDKQLGSIIGRLNSFYTNGLRLNDVLNGTNATKSYFDLIGQAQKINGVLDSPDQDIDIQFVNSNGTASLKKDILGFGSDDFKREVRDKMNLNLNDLQRSVSKREISNPFELVPVELPVPNSTFKIGETRYFELPNQIRNDQSRNAARINLRVSDNENRRTLKNNGKNVNIEHTAVVQVELSARVRKVTVDGVEKVKSLEFVDAGMDAVNLLHKVRSSVDAVEIIRCYFKKEEKNKPTEYIELITDANNVTTYLVKSNLSPKTHPPIIIDSSSLFEESEVNYTTRVSNTDDFVRILWEGSVTNNGGYFLMDYSESEVFNTELAGDKDQVQLIFSFESAKNAQFISASNYLKVEDVGLGETSLFDSLDKGAHSLYAELFDVDSQLPVLEYQPVIPAHCFAFNVERENNENQGEEFEHYLPLEYAVNTEDGVTLLGSDEVLPVMPQSPQFDNTTEVAFGNERLFYKHVSPITEVIDVSKGYRYENVGKKFKVEMGLRDVFGFRAASLGDSLTLQHQYFDKLEPISSWPYIKISYWLDKFKDEKLVWKLSVNVFDKKGNYENTDITEGRKTLLLIQDQINDQDAQSTNDDRIRFSMEGFEVSEVELRKEIRKAVNYALEQLEKEPTKWKPKQFSLKFTTAEIADVRTELAPTITITRNSAEDFFVQVPNAEQVWGASEIKSTRFSIPLKNKDEGAMWENLDDTIRKESKDRYAIGMSSAETFNGNADKSVFIIDLRTLHFEVKNEQPLSRERYFGLVPYSTQKWTGTYNGQSFGEKVDLDLCLRSILSKIDQLLAPDGLSGFTEEEIKSHVEILIRSKKLLVEDELKSRLDNIDTINSAVPTEMREELRKLLLEKTNHFYEYDGLINVALDSDNQNKLEEYRLTVDIPQVKGYNLISSKIDCRGGSPGWTILFDQIGSNTYIELDFEPSITHLEFDIEPIPGVDEVEKSTWIQLFKPVKLPKISTTHIKQEDKWPRVYREFPPLPHLKKHFAKQKFNEQNASTWNRELGQWSYVMQIDDTEYEKGSTSQYFPGDILRVYLSTKKFDPQSLVGDTRNFEGFIAYWSLKFASGQQEHVDVKNFILQLHGELLKNNSEGEFALNSGEENYFELTKNARGEWSETYSTSKLFKATPVIIKQDSSNLKSLQVTVTSPGFNVLGDPEEFKIRSILSEAEAYRNKAVRNSRFQYITGRSKFATWVTPHITFFNPIKNESLHESVFQLLSSLKLPYKVTSKWLLNTHDLETNRKSKLPVIPIEQMEFDAGKSPTPLSDESSSYDQKFSAYNNGFAGLSVTLYDQTTDENKVDLPLFTAATIFRNKDVQELSVLNIGGKKVIDACKKHWETNKGDCNAFVKAVAIEVGVTLTGNADSIVEQITNAQWTNLGKDGLKAKKKAEEGWLVIGGLKSNDHNPARNHGHVVVVVAGTVAHGKYPRAYWGALGGTPRQNETINYSWRKVDRDNVVYGAIKIE